MTWVMVDVEADGPCPGLYSMVSLGAVVVEPGLKRSFYSEVIRPLGNYEGVKTDWQPEALRVSGVSREEQLAGRDPLAAMSEFRSWLDPLDSPRFVADNNGFDWQFINYYFHSFLRVNPFGYSSTNLGSLYKGMVQDMRQNFKHLRKTKHTHHPVDDARGNAEAMVAMRAMGLKIEW